LVSEFRLCWIPEQAPSSGAPRIRPIADRLVAPIIAGSGTCRPEIVDPEPAAQDVTEPNGVALEANHLG
jgi:hypothetical protein